MGFLLALIKLRLLPTDIRTNFGSFCSSIVIGWIEEELLHVGGGFDRNRGGPVATFSREQKVIGSS